MEYDPDGEGARRLNDWLHAEAELRAFVGTAHKLNPGEATPPPRQIDQAFLNQFDALQKVRDVTESSYRAWLAGRVSPEW